MEKRIKHWETVYTSKYSGSLETHINSNSEGDARGWTKNLSEDNGCKAVCNVVYEDGSKKHVTSEGDNR